MSGRLEGRIALVTGAGRGINRSVALAFAREGADVAAADLDAESVEATAKDVRALGRRALALQCDVGRSADCQRIVDDTARDLGGLDILVNGAAWARTDVPIQETTDELYQRTMDVCMSSVFWTMRAAHPHLKASGRGAVINFTSNAGSEGHAGNAPYAAAKEAIRGFSRSLAAEWGADNIRVNLIRPFALSPAVVDWREQNPTMARAQDRGIPLGRVGDCDDDVAPCAVFLASDEARYLTAVTLPVDGGGGRER